MRHLSIACAVFCSFLLLISSSFGDTFYVDLLATGNSDGSSWQDAFTGIQDGINAASDGDRVVVAEGIYFEHDIDFKGAEITVISSNGPENTIVDGETESCVFYFHTNENKNSVLSGFTIKNGKRSTGGGIYCNSSSPTIDSCIITENSASYGGGIYCRSSSVEIIQCVIINNSVGYYGGGVYLSDDSPTITNSTITENNAAYGGGGVHSETSLNISGCIINKNYGYHGGGVYFYSSSASGSEMVNCVISDNQAKYGGGIRIYNASPVVFNCTIANNVINTEGGSGSGISCTSSSAVFTNCILWNTLEDEISLLGDSNALIVTYSDIRGGYGNASDNNIDVSPQFIDGAGGDYHLTPSSECINRGTSVDAPDSDIEGSLRPQGGAFDMGAYEHVFVFDFDFDGDVDGLDLVDFSNSETLSDTYMELFASKLGVLLYPTVISTHPADAQTGVPVDSMVEVTFSKKMDAVTLNQDTFLVTEGANIVSGSVVYDGTTQTVCFKPSAGLSFETEYTVTLKTGITGDDGLPIPSDISFSFSTEVYVPPPEVTQTFPGNGQTDINIDSQVIITFSKEMDVSTLTADNIIITDGANSVEGSFLYNESNRRLIFEHTEHFTRDTLYFVTLTTEVAAVDGRPLQNEYSFSFLTTDSLFIPYCISCANQPESIWIKKVTVGVESYFSYRDSCNNYTNITFNLGAPSTDIAVETDYSVGPEWVYFSIWIDWNKDGTFNDADEHIMNAYGESLSGNIVLPAHAISGSTRMRVSMQRSGGFPEACNQIDFGEVEDYTVFIP